MRNINASEINAIANVKKLAKKMYLEYQQGLSDLNVPPRTLIRRENPHAIFCTMPAHSERHHLFITKIGSVVPQDNLAAQSVHSMVVAFSSKTGNPLAILAGDAVTNLKCAAVSALVTDLCALPQAKTLAIIGSGVQACAQIQGVTAVRKLEQVRVYSRNSENVTRFIKGNKKIYGDIEFIACKNSNVAIETAEIISTTTTSATPVISADALTKPFVHINCMGNHIKDSRELPLSVLQQSLLVVEDIETAIAEAGEVHRNALTIDQLIYQNPENLRRQQTVFASTGHAFLDLITVDYLLSEM